MTEIALKNVVNVTLSGLPRGLSVPNINTIGLFTGEHPTWSSGEAYRIYKNASEVAKDFGSDSKAAQHATAIFAQNPNVLNTRGYVACIPYSPTRTAATKAKLEGAAAVDVTPIAAGTYKFKVNGTAYDAVFSAAPANAKAVVDVVNAIASFPATLSSDRPTAKRATFTLTSKTAGKSATLSIEAAPSADLAALLKLAPGSSNGSDAISAETLKDAIVRTSHLVHYTGILSTENTTDDDLLKTSDHVQTLDKLVFFASKFENTVDGGIFSAIQSKSNTHSRCLLYTGSKEEARLFAAAYAGRALSTNFSGDGTTGTMHLKSLATIAPDKGITQSLLAKCEAAGVDVYGSFRGIPAVYTTGGNAFFDNVYNGLWFKSALQVGLFNFLRQTNTKIPQSEKGMTGLKNACSLVCRKAVANAYIAPGAWDATSPTFGNPTTFRKNIEDFGYYIYSQPIALQDPADRANRKAPLVQIAMKAAGAMHSIDAIVTIKE